MATIARRAALPSVLAVCLIILFTMSGVDARPPCNTCVCHGPAERFIAPNATLKLGRCWICFGARAIQPEILRRAHRLCSFALHLALRPRLRPTPSESTPIPVASACLQSCCPRTAARAFAPPTMSAKGRGTAITTGRGRGCSTTG